MIKKYVCLLIIFLLCSIAGKGWEEGDDAGFENSEDFIKLSKSLLGIPDNEEQGDDQGSGGSSQIILLPEVSPIRVSRTIVSPLRDEYFHNETIVCEVKVTSIRTEGAKNLRIWEIPSEGLSILNCSYPIVSTSVEVINDYENSDKSSLKREDINIKQVLKILMARKNNSEMKRIRELFSNDTNNNITKIDTYNKSELESISIDILNDFNKIIENPTNLDFNSSHLSISPRNFAGNNDTDYYIDSREYSDHIEKQDYRLLKRKLLEYVFSSNESADGIRKLSFNKKHENLINGPINYIYFEVPSLREHESLVFKYYLNTSDLGKNELQSEIHADSFHHEEKTHIEIIERRPKFKITYLCPSEELITDTSTEFEYSIEYLGGDENMITSNLIINPVKNSPTDESYCTVEPQFFNNVTFAKGKIKKINTSVKYSHIGDRLSPPTITINDEETKFDPDISVHHSWNAWVKKYSEIISAFVIILALLELIYIFYERRSQLEERQESQRRLDEYNKTITRFTEITTNYINDRGQRSSDKPSCCMAQYLDSDEE